MPVAASLVGLLVGILSFNGSTLFRKSEDNSACLTILTFCSINAFNLRIIRRMKKIIPSIIEIAEKVLMTPIKTPKKE